MDKLGGHYAQSNKQATEGQILYLHEVPGTVKHTETEHRRVGAQGWVRAGELEFNGESYCLGR